MEFYHFCNNKNYAKTKQELKLKNQKIYFFTDIDDTLIQTKRKTNFDFDTEPAGFKETGEISSYIYKKNLILLKQLLNAGIEIIPTTARDLNSYRRTIFYSEFKFSKIILNFSAEIYEKNQKNLEWDSIIKNQYQKLPISLDEIQKTYSDFIKKHLLTNNIPQIKNIKSFYLSIYNKNFPTDKKLTSEIRNLTEIYLQENSLNDNFYIYQNDASIGILPSFLNKKHATEFLINKYNPILTIGAGDNSSDFDFMNLTDFSLIPKKSNLNTNLNQALNLK
jgi:hypothetical protein